MGTGKLVGWSMLIAGTGQAQHCSLCGSPAEVSIGKDGMSPQLQVATEAVGLLGSSQ